MSRRLYVGNLPHDTIDRDLEDEFRKFGRIYRVELKGRFGFVEFDDDRDADDAMRALDGINFHGNRIIVEIANGRRRDRFDGERRAPQRSEYRVTVDGLPRDVSWQTLKDHLRRGGDVIYVDITGPGTAIAEFRTIDEMDRAIDKMDDTEIDGEIIRVREDRGDGGGYRNGGRYSPYGRGRSPSPRGGYRRRSPSPRGGYRRRSPSPRGGYRRRSPGPRDRSRTPPRRNGNGSPRGGGSYPRD